MLEFLTMSSLVALLLAVTPLLTEFRATADPVTDVDNVSYWICKSGRRVRTIRVHVGENGLCSTFYSKDGAEKNVGSGKNRESCLNFLTNIKTNLEKSSWTCRDISTSHMSSAED